MAFDPVQLLKTHKVTDLYLRRIVFVAKMMETEGLGTVETFLLTKCKDLLSVQSKHT